MCFTTISDAVRVTSCRYFDGRGRRIIIAGGQLDGGSSTSKDSSTRDHRRGGTAGRRITIAGEQLDAGSSTSKDSSTRDHRQRISNRIKVRHRQRISRMIKNIIVGGAAGSSSAEDQLQDQGHHRLRRSSRICVRRGSAAGSRTSSEAEQQDLRPQRISRRIKDIVGRAAGSSSGEDQQQDQGHHPTEKGRSSTSVQGPAKSQVPST